MNVSDFLGFSSLPIVVPGTMTRFWIGVASLSSEIWNAEVSRNFPTVYIPEISRVESI